ncbi:MAG: cob(I)yrinic acid a,c-diamide adenosyltransferase [Clostridia bacterium]|nr:cob(I)yrinic acid a,c-diamide adenosyltransferase [Clostridia bacterium]
MKGLIHIYTGDGKGKTTASIGLIIRALGYDKKILFIQMQKAIPSGEINVLLKNNSIDVLRCSKIKKFLWDMSEQEKREYVRQHEQGFQDALRKIGENNYDLVVFDEIIGAVNENALNKNELLDFLHEKPENLEVVLTGRNASEDLIEIADYVSEIKCIKHPFEKGVQARKGVEY